MESRRTVFLPLLAFIIIANDCSSGNKIFGKFGSVRVSYDIPLDNQWGRSWPEGIKLVDNFESLPAKTRNNDGSLSPHALQSNRRLAPVTRTYNWQAEELMISYNTTGIANPTCTRLEPPVTWLAASGARVKVLHSGGSSDLENLLKLDLNQPISCNSIIEVSVSKSFAESSLRTLRNKGFTREDIYRMLDKGPWVLAFDISSALPRLFASLQGDLGVTQLQAVHIVSHCPYLIAQYARYKGRDVFATAKALMDVGYTLPKLVSDVMRFPSMLAAPPDRIRGWAALLSGFGVAEEPSLFGKMLRRAPFMFYVNAPKLQDDDLSHVVDSDVSATASGFVAYGALSVLQLLKSQNFPDLDKLVRTQPLILLVDTSEVKQRAEFLVNLFLENMPSIADTAAKNAVNRNADNGLDRDLSDAIIASREGARINAKASRIIKKPKNSIVTTQVVCNAQQIDPEVSLLTGTYGSAHAEDDLKYDEVASASAVVSNQHLAHDMLGGLLLTYPAVLSINHSQMRAAGNALRTAGLRRGEVLQIARRHPPVLGRDPALLINLISFLRFNCGLHKVDLLPFLSRYPAVLGAEVKDIEPKVDYLFQTLGGSQEMLRRFPSFLSFDLEAHTRPRAEFLRALKIDPLINGLAFLVNAPPKEIAYTAGVRVELFNQFQSAYAEMWKKKVLREKSEIENSVAVKRDVEVKQEQFSIWMKDNSNPVDRLLDELDFSF